MTTLSRTVVGLLAIAILAAVGPAVAAQAPSPVEREIRHLTFDDAAAAERFFDALNVVLNTRGQPGAIQVRWDGSSVEISGPPDPMCHLAALLGGQPQPEPQVALVPPKAPKPDSDRPERPQVRHETPPAGEAPPADRQRDRQRDRRPSLRQEPAPELAVCVFALQHAEAFALEEFVDMLRVGTEAPWVVECDERTNSIVVKGPTFLIEEAEQLIRQLDQPARFVGGEPVMQLVPLSHADARALAEVVSRAGCRSMSDLVAVPDVRTNTIVLAGPKAQLREAASLIEKLDAAPRPEPAAKQPPPKKPKAAQKRARQEAAPADEATNRLGPPPVPVEPSEAPSLPAMPTDV